MTPTHAMWAAPLKAPATLSVTFAGACTLVAAAPADGRPLPRFTMVAYTGGPMRPHVEPPLKFPVVVDLAGLDCSEQVRPALKDHDPKQLVGHTESIDNDGRQLTAGGVVSGVGPAAAEVVEAARNGFTWQVSMGANIGGLEFVPAAQTVQVNGRRVAGPVYVARSGRVRELSFLTLGADDTTSARIAANAAEGFPMDFEQWLKSLGLDPAALSDEAKAVLQKQFDATQAAAAKARSAKAEGDGDGEDTVQANDGEDTLEGDGKGTVKAGRRGGAAVDPAEAAIAEIRAKRQAETRRLAQLDVLAEKYKGDVEASKLLAAQERAIGEGWTVDRFELQLLRDRRPVTPSAPLAAFAKAGAAQLTDAVIEAGFCLAGGLTDVDERFDEKVLEAADKRFRRSISLQEILLEAAWANGYTGRNFKSDPREVLRYAYNVQASGGGFSTINVAGILSNTANKYLLEGFEHVEMAWQQIATTRPVSDFKQITSYRLTGSGQYEKVAPGVALKHGKLDEESFTNQAATYGLMLSITRADIINDDLGAFTQAPRKLGRGAGLKLNDVFWTAFLDNSTFFTTARNNYFEGGSTNLQSSSLKTAVQMFRRQVDSDGKPLGVAPKLLLVGPENEVAADELYTSTNNNTGGSATTEKVPNRNVHAGKYKPVVSAYLSNSSYTGYSTTGWYLLADPMDVSVVEVAFLNGQQSPTIETSDADFSQLGIQLRGYHDFGVSKQDHRGGVKSKGAA